MLTRVLGFCAILVSLYHLTTVAQASPNVTSLSPTVGPVTPVGGPVTIKGTNFGALQGSSSVTFAGISASPTSWSDTKIVVTVPNSLSAGFANVVVTVNGVSSNAQSFLVIPVVTQDSPNPATVETLITITGTSFGAQQEASTVTFNGTPGVPTSWSNTNIAVPVPVGATNGALLVTVNGFDANAPTFYIVPNITALLPGATSIGMPVTIKGNGFGQTPGFGGVTFNGISAVVQSWSDTSISVTVPTGATTGNVVVTASDLLASSGVNFSVLPPAITSIAVSPASASTPAGLTAKFRATGTFSDGTTKDVTTSATWSSTSPEVATVSSIGLASALVPGSATIQATVGSVTGSAGFTVQPPALIKLTVQPALGGTTVGGTQQFTAVGAYTDGTTPDLTATATWSSSSSATATVASGGLSTGVASGSAVITAKVGGTSGTANLNVTAGVTQPTITAVATPPANANGWNDGNVTVAFTCKAGSAAIVNCPTTQLITSEGASQVISGTVTDAAGNNATASVTLNIDTTPPAATVTSPADGTLFSSASVSVTGSLSDALSGASGVSCNGSPATLSSGLFSCTVTLNAGANLIFVQGSDVAGNKSAARVHAFLSGALPPPTSLTITPANVSMLVRDAKSFVAIDDQGRPRPDATWSVADSTVATVAADGSGGVTAMAPGSTVLTASVGTISAQTPVAVFAGPSFPPGTINWVASTGPTVDLVQATPVPDEGSPDLYSVAGGVVRALTIEGAQLWVTQVPGNNFSSAVSDNNGGILLDFNGSDRKLVDLDPQTGAIVWQYQYPSAADSARRIAVGPDGTIFFREVRFLPDPQFPNITDQVWSLVALDGSSGARTSLYTAPTSTLQDLGLCNGQGFTIPHPFKNSMISNPSVGPDGKVFASTVVYNEVQGSDCGGNTRFDNPGVAVSLLAGPGALLPLQTLSSVLADGSSPVARLFDVIADGQGGALASWAFINRSGQPETHIGGTSANFTVPFDIFNYVSMVLGDQNTLFASNGIQIFGMSSGGGINWTFTAPPQAVNGVSLIASTAGGGLVAKTNDGSTDSIIRFDAGGNLSTDSWDTGSSALIAAGYFGGDKWLGVGTNAFVEAVSGSPVSAALTVWPQGDGNKQKQKAATPDCLPVTETTKMVGQNFPIPTFTDFDQTVGGVAGSTFSFQGLRVKETPGARAQIPAFGKALDYLNFRPFRPQEMGLSAPGSLADQQSEATGCTPLKTPAIGDLTLSGLFRTLSARSFKTAPAITSHFPARLL